MDTCCNRRLECAIALWLALLTGVAATLHAQDKPQAGGKEEPKLGWSNASDLSLVVAGGNSNSTTFGFSNDLRLTRKTDRFEIDVNVVRANKADDRFFRVEAGLEFPVGDAPDDPATSLITPDPTLDVANYLVAGRYERDVSPKVFWSTGLSWYRNDDAGILNRYILFAGVGHKWANSQRRRFTTSYGISYTDREEEEPDPEKTRHFGGARAGWDYTERFNTITTFDSDFGWNLNLTDGKDYSFNSLNALTVSMTTRLSLKVSLQWLYENEPALESDLDVIAFVELINPDGVAGTGDERFRTLDSGGSKIVLGSADARKNKLDTLVRTALVLKF